MKKKIKSHPGHIGPAISLDIADISVIEEYGDRNSTAGWVDAEITLKNSKVVKVRLGIADMDQLISDWESLNG